MQIWVAREQVLSSSASAPVLSGMARDLSASAPSSPYGEWQLRSEAASGCSDAALSPSRGEEFSFADSMGAK